jgi:hypothetical protein
VEFSECASHVLDTWAKLLRIVFFFFFFELRLGSKVTDRQAVLWVNACGPLNGWVGYNKMGFIPLWLGLW